MSDDSDNNDDKTPENIPSGKDSYKKDFLDAMGETPPENKTPPDREPIAYDKGFGIMSAIGDGISLYAKNFINVTLMIFLSQLALHSFTFLQSGHFAAASPTLMQDGFISYFTTLLVSIAAGSLFGIAAMFGALCSLNGRQIKISAMMGRSINVWPQAVTAQIIAQILMMIGFLFLIIPGMVIALMLIPLGAVIAWENPGIMESLDRSKKLTDGYKWPLLGLLAVITIPIVIIALMLGLAASPMIVADPATSSTFIQFVLTTLAVSALTCIIAVVYMQLRNEHGN